MKKGNIFELTATCEELKGFYRITILRGEIKYSESGLEERRSSGVIHIPKLAGLPKQIVIDVIQKKEVREWESI
jgi:hypothetical protein